jgi:hypothetical protein
MTLLSVLYIIKLYCLYCKPRPLLTRNSKISSNIIYDYIVHILSYESCANILVILFLESSFLSMFFIVSKISYTLWKIERILVCTKISEILRILSQKACSVAAFNTNFKKIFYLELFLVGNRCLWICCVWTYHLLKFLLFCSLKRN